MLWVAGAGHLFAGNVDLHAMFWLLPGADWILLAGLLWGVREQRQQRRSEPPTLAPDPLTRHI